MKDNEIDEVFKKSIKALDTTVGKVLDANGNSHHVLLSFSIIFVLCYFIVTLGLFLLVLFLLLSLFLIFILPLSQPSRFFGFMFHDSWLTSSSRYLLFSLSF